MTLDFIQIYYADDQLKECYDFATPYRNNTLTDYFENSVIKYLVPKSSADYIGIASWRLRQKRQDGFCPMILKIYGNDDLSLDKLKDGIRASDADIVNLRPFSSSHRMLHMANVYHGGSMHDYAWDNAMKELKNIIDIPEEVETPIYENAFICRSDIYKSYVAGCLNPVIDFMSTRSVFFADSGYARKKERTDPKAVEIYKAKTGRLDWPIAPFVLERLFSIWINGKQFKIINL
jgi:hypothetical protein